ncbi:MAG TPA: VWA domain-containing protein [Pyrinomonadaceae bacterium]|nr:VWA domain-containing protein [Pyrinomonadaceae bacterium]
MKRFAYFILIVCALSALAAQAQSRRVPPGKGTDKPNARPAATAPEATPTPILVSSAPDDTGAVESGDVEAVETRLVTIPVRVIDRKNRFIGGLQKESFKVFEDNVEQEIAYFTNEAQPFTVALVLDMSYSTTFKIGEIQSAAISFIDQLRPEDKVLVISFDEDVHMLCEPTSERGTIYRAIRSTSIATGTSLYDAVGMTINDRMRTIKGRKAIVLFTDGVDTTSRRSNDYENLRDALELDALIYPIRYDTFADVQSMKNKTIIDMPTSRPKPPTGGGSPFPTSIPGVPTARTANDKGTTAEEYRAAEEYLNQLAERTSGTIYLASTLGNLNAAFSKIASELREFYRIGYYPAKEGTPGKMYRIKVKVSQPNVAVRARDSYVVPKKKKLRTS